MKFNDGYWLLREGVTARYATEALDVRTETESVSIAVLTRPVEHRGSHLNTATITVELSAPAPDVIAVRASHFVSEVEPAPRFELTPSPADARVEPGRRHAAPRVGPAGRRGRRRRRVGACASPATARR